MRVCPNWRRIVPAAPTQSGVRQRSGFCTRRRRRRRPACMCDIRLAQVLQCCVGQEPESRLHHCQCPLRRSRHISGTIPSESVACESRTKDAFLRYFFSPSFCSRSIPLFYLDYPRNGLRAQITQLPTFRSTFGIVSRNFYPHFYLSIRECYVLLARLEMCSAQDTSTQFSKMGSAAQQYCLRWNNHRSNLLTVFDELLQNEAFTDVTLVCDGGSPLKCHRMVLAACSPYFQNLFTDLPCKHPVVVLKDVKYSEIKAILEYMYRGEVNVAQDQLAALLKVAEALKVKGLVEENRGGDRGRLNPREGPPMNHSPPGMIPSTTNTPTAVHSSSNNNNNSPPHSTNGVNFSKSPYNLYGKAPSIERNSRMNMPMWAVPGIPLPHHPSPVPSQNYPNAAATAAAVMLSSCYEAAGSDMSPLKRKKLSSLLMNRDTPILRTVLGQGQADSSQPVSLVCHPDNHESLSNSVPEDRVERHVKNEPSEDAQSPYTDFAVMDEDEKPKMGVPSSSPQSYTTEMRGISSGIATYVPTQKPEWKRYKQYTRDDIMSAIEAVRNGMSALQAARKYRVPSRTLYDKVKKLGITTSRPFKRGSNGSSACFPYGISGTSSPYDNDEHSMNNNSALLEASSFLQHALDGRGGDEREALAAMAAAAAAHAHAAATGHSTSPPNHGMPRSPSPSPSLMKYMRQSSLTPSPAPESEPHHSETNGSSERDREEEDDHVEDLSISRKQESRVIMPPMNQVSTIIKKEDIMKDSFKDDIRREVSVDEGE